MPYINDISSVIKTLQLDLHIENGKTVKVQKIHPRSDRFYGISIT